MDASAPATTAADLRLLEGWLPLAAAANARYGWGLGAAALEALILRAAPRLAQAESALAAAAILWVEHRREQPAARPR